MKNISLFLTAVLLFNVLLIKNAHAYLDPGTGSYVLQLLIGVIVGGIFALKVFWKNVVSFFKNIFSGKKEEQKV